MVTDDTKLGKNYRFEVNHGDGTLYLNAIQLLRNELQGWNVKAINRGASKSPYSSLFDRLDEMAEWFERELKNSRSYITDIVSTATLELENAALMFAYYKEKEKLKIDSVGWPEAVKNAAANKANKFKALADNIPCPPAKILSELGYLEEEQKNHDSVEWKWDAFISHASEDKAGCVTKLAALLNDRGMQIWIDDTALIVGGSLRESIDLGLSQSRFGIVILSHAFFNKKWPQKELDGLFARENQGAKVILPVWHELSSTDIIHYSPMLSGRIAVSTDIGLDKVADKLVLAMGS